MEVLIIDEVGPIRAGLIDRLTRRGRDVLIVDYKTKGDAEMGTLNRGLLTAALLSGLVVATAGGQQVPAQYAASQLSPEPHFGGKRRKTSSKASNAAAHKRAKAKRRNIARRASKRA